MSPSSISKQYFKAFAKLEPLSNSITWRDAVPDDAEWQTEIYNELVKTAAAIESIEPRPVEERRLAIEEGHGVWPCVVALEDGHPVGCELLSS